MQNPEGSGVLFLPSLRFFPGLRSGQPCGDDAEAAAEGLRGGASAGSSFCSARRYRAVLSAAQLGTPPLQVVNKNQSNL